MLLLAILGSLGGIQMFLCNLGADTIGLMSKSEPFINKLVNKIDSSDFVAKYSEGVFSITIKDTDTIKGTTISMNIYNVIKDYLGDCEYDNPPPLYYYYYIIIDNLLLIIYLNMLQVLLILKHLMKVYFFYIFFNIVIDKASDNGVSGDLLTTLDDFVKKDVTIRIKEMLDTLLVSGTLGCKEVNTVMKSLGTYACCEVMGNFVAAGSMTYIYIIYIVYE